MGRTEQTLSITRRTSLLVLLVLVGFNLLLAGLTWVESDHEVEELFDAQLAQSARILMALVQGAINQDSRDNLLKSVARHLDDFQTGSLPLSGHKYEAKVSFQVWRDGELLFRSASAPPTPLSLMPSGYATESMGEHQWRVFILDEPDNQVRLITAERLDIRGELVDNITWTILIIDLAGMLVLAAWIGLSIRIGLTPLQKMAHTLAERHPQHLDRLEFGRLPAELIPMGAAINDLLHQLQELLAREKRFLADASHELRTPLAVIRLHAQNAANLPPCAERERALQLLYSGLDRTTHLISQLLTLARLEPEVDAPATLRLDLLSETRQVLAELDTLAQDHQVELVLSANEQDDWEIHLEAGALSTLLNNLVSNAIRHAPAQTQVEIDLQSNPTALRMRVIDHGCGIPDAQRSHLGERFFHVGPHAGAGLGLAIVKRVMARHGGDVCFQTTSGGGLTVQVDLPRGFSESG